MDCPAAAVGLERGAKAGIVTPVAAGASGAEAIARAWRNIVLGEADMAICGGVETKIEAVPIAAYTHQNLLSTNNDDAITRAIRLAGLTPADIDHVNAHAAGTVEGDLAEARAIRHALGNRYPAVYAPKAALGDSIGAVGAVEAILTVLAVRDGIIPPTLNLQTLDPEIDLDVVSGESRPGDYRYAVSDSFSFRWTQRRPCLRSLLTTVTVPAATHRSPGPPPAGRPPAERAQTPTRRTTTATPENWPAARRAEAGGSRATP